MACGATLKRTYEFDPLHSPIEATPIKRRRCTPLTVAPTLPQNVYQQTSPSPFSAVSSKLSKEEIAARIESELRKIQRRKQLFYPTSHSPPPSACTAAQHSPTSSSCSSDVSHLPVSGTSSPKQKDAPLFTFSQVTLLCERMIRDREDKLRQSYDQVLANKLSEQYEAFLKFNHDQMQTRFRDTTVSYVS